MIDSLSSWDIIADQVKGVNMPTQTISLYMHEAVRQGHELKMQNIEPTHVIISSNIHMLLKQHAQHISGEKNVGDMFVGLQVSVLASDTKDFIKVV